MEWNELSDGVFVQAYYKKKLYISMLKLNFSWQETNK